ncbi:MAG TPA: high-affinity branched-chain amino acid ABC transporter permease LivM [Verrucomicrobiae bacterium]|nr:high-affinity branched-chain amino acid ABC transporter permease LivM [Verrucomicrobiae bacterium]
MALLQETAQAKQTEASAVTPEMLKQAVAVGVITFLLASLIVGIETVSSTGALDFTTRYKEVFIATIGVFVGSLVISQLRAGRPQVGVIVAGGVSVVLLLLLLVQERNLIPKEFLPFKSMIINWGSLIIPVAIFLRSSQEMRRQRALARGQVVVSRNVVEAVQRAMPWIGAGMIVLAIALPWLPLGDRTQEKKIIDICTIVLTYIMLGWGLNIVVGLAGLLDLGYVAFYAVGAYTYAMASVYLGWSFWVCLPLAGLLAATFGVLLGFPVLRLRGDYLAIVTLGFGEMIRIIIVNWRSLTGGPNGINRVPRASFFGLPMERNVPEGVTSFSKFFGIEYNPNHRVIFLYYLVLLAALAVNFFTLRIRKLPLGRAWEALREDETACRALGINPTNTKLTAFAVGAMFGGFAGSFFAVRNAFISPESFVFLESAIILAIVVLGGLGSQVGIVLAASVLIGVPELFRELSEYRMLAFGIGMVLIMIWRPGGLLAHREPTIRLHPSGGPPPDTKKK